MGGVIQLTHQPKPDFVGTVISVVPTATAAGLTQNAARLDLHNVAGQTQDLAVKLGRGQGLDQAARVELVVPKHMQGVQAEPVVIAAGQTSGLLKIRYSKDAHGPFNMPLTVRATVLVNKQRYTAEKKFEVFAPR